jgi:hypothetical protein
MTLGCPVALFVYNRGMYLSAILQRIHAAHPTKLYIFGDGPKNDPEDRARCAAVRRSIAEIQWPFPIELTFAPANLGMNCCLVSGIDEVFAREERAIFLEDDVELSESFFPYCDWLLDTYEHDDRIAMISGVNPLSNWPTAEATCFFSKLGNAQAWATWRRAWRFFAGSPALWAHPQTHAAISEFLGDPELFAWRAGVYGRLGVWDEQWALARQSRQSLCVIPAKNLVVHRGRGPSATHVKTRGVLDAIAARHEIVAPFQAPTAVTADDRFDRLYFEATQNRLSTASAQWLAKRLMARGRNLLAIAVLRHAAAGTPPDPETVALIEDAAFQGRASSRIPVEVRE